MSLNRWILATSKLSKVPADQVSDIARISLDLWHFRDSREGATSMLLLGAAKTMVVFGSDEVGWVYGWGCFGPTRAHPGLPSITSFFSDEMPASFVNVAKAMVQSGKQPEEMLPWLRAELDKVAEQALR